MQRQIRWFPYGERSDVPRLQQVEQKAVGRQRNLGLHVGTTLRTLIYMDLIIQIGLEATMGITCICHCLCIFIDSQQGSASVSRPVFLILYPKYHGYYRSHKSEIMSMIVNLPIAQRS